MKKIISIIVICLFAKGSIAQNNAYEGNANTITNFASSGSPTAFGLAKANFVNAAIFADTTACNSVNFLKNYNGTQLITYSGGTKFWIRYGGSWNQVGSGSGWGITGNAGTTAGTNFLGTTDNVDLIFKRNSTTSGIVAVNNTSFGYASLNTTLSNTGNVVFGNYSLSNITSGGNNTIVGHSSGAGILTASNNTVLGTSAGAGTGSENTSIGSSSLAIATSGRNNIALGYYSGGYNTTQSNRLYINSLSRSNILGDTTKSIIYGYQDATASNQRLYLNSKLYAPYLSTGIPSGAKRALIGTDGQMYAADTTSGGGTSQWTRAGNYIYPATITDSIGIGTATPTAALDVFGDIHAPDRVVKAGSFMTTNEVGLLESNQLYITNGSTLGRIAFLHADGDYNKIELGDIENTINGNKFILSDSGYNFYDNIAHDGKFGINTSTPSVALDVVGGVQFKRDSLQFINVGTLSGTSFFGASLNNNGSLMVANLGDTTGAYGGSAIKLQADVVTGFGQTIIGDYSGAFGNTKLTINDNGSAPFNNNIILNATGGIGINVAPDSALTVNTSGHFKTNLRVDSAVNIQSTQTTVNAATSGTIVCSMPFRGSSYKKVIIYCNATLGAATYTFPVSFTYTPIDVTSTGTVTSLTTTSITITGATSTGFIIIEGY